MGGVRAEFGSMIAGLFSRSDFKARKALL